MGSEYLGDLHRGIVLIGIVELHYQGPNMATALTKHAIKALFLSVISKFHIISMISTLLLLAE